MSIKFLACITLTAVAATFVGAVTVVAQTNDQRLAELEQELAALRAAIAARGSDPARLEELERRIDVLAAELERIRLGEATARADASSHGLGPAASKVYRGRDGVSLGGYGELIYQNFDSHRDDGSPSGKGDQVDLLRAVFYVGYKFDERFVLNTELEVEHATTGEGAEEKGEVSAEFAYLDYLWRDEVNVRAGLILVPLGLVNELHEPTVFLGVNRPQVERAIIPTTWREAGIGVFGDVGPFSYRTYVMTGLRAEGFDAAGVRDGRQGGSKASAEDVAWAGRLDYTGAPGLLAGISAFVGEAGQGLVSASGRPLDVGVTILDAHLDWKRRGWRVRALAVQASIDDVGELNATLGLEGAASVGSKLRGAYTELGYDVLASRGGRQSLTPFVRWESFDTQWQVPDAFTRNPANDVEILTFGVAFQPIDQVVIKLDWQNVDNRAGTGVDQLNVALGYIF